MRAAEPERGSRPSPADDLGVRLILATRTLDRAYARLDRLRSTLILALAPDAVLERFNEWTYSRSEAYQPSSSGFRRELFRWEEDAIARFFPAPPARVLVGGAGAGREPLRLAAMGFDVVAFEPAPALCEALAAVARVEGAGVEAFRAGYEDLPRLTRTVDGSAADLQELGPFDAAIFGWGSFSHIRTRALRVETLRSFARVTQGPMLASFLAVKDDSSAGGRRRARRLLARHGRETDDRFSMHLGFRHSSSPSEVESLAREAGLDVVELEFRGGDALAPYVVLRPREGAEAAREGVVSQDRPDSPNS
jgi:hypothetical protein